MPLVGAEIVLGRDPSSDLRFDHAVVSRRHAVMRARGNGYTIQDLGSANGTRINGAGVAGTSLLRDGDHLQLGGQIDLIYEQGLGAARRSWGPIGVAILLIGLLAGVALWYMGQRPPDYGEATKLAAEGLRASRAGDHARAKDSLRSAAGMLYKRGLLDDVARPDVMRVAMQRLGASLDPPADLWTIFQASLAETQPKPPPTNIGDSAPVGCRLDRVGPASLEPCLRERIELVMIALRQDPSQIPEGFPRKVGRRMRQEHAFIERSLQRGKSVIPMLRRELEAAKMPPLLHYLALIESGYQNTAVSSAKAMGMWQFMPATGRQYGLRVGGPNDERSDTVKATRAAARYLRDLAFEFGGDALLLALAGYNRGENGVRRALKKLDDPFSDRSYWRLVEEGLLPEETSQYVTRFIAAASAGEGGLPAASTLEAAGF